MDQPIGLYELNCLIKSEITTRFSDSYWIIAEISDLTMNRSGHCYLELIEKGPKSDKIIAKSRATIWSYTFRMLKPYFEITTGFEFTAGIKILVNATVEFHELYGLSLNIKDIDPVYTLGDLAKKRQEILKRLEDEGVINLNKELAFPLVPQRIAIISSSTAAGFGDFTNQLKHNPYGYKFIYKLYPSVMQGDEAEPSIISALEQVYSFIDEHDLVVIIRGGGSKAELSCFDSYWLSFNVAQFPLPVVTRIGHERDETIIDLVANTHLKTPTAVAELLIQKFAEFENLLDEARKLLKDRATLIINNENLKLESIFKDIQVMVSGILERNKGQINLFSNKLENAAKQFVQQRFFEILNYSERIKYLAGNQTLKQNQRVLKLFDLFKEKLSGFQMKENQRIALFENTLEHLNPGNVLKRGYSLTVKNGKVIKDAFQLIENDEITTILQNGKVESKVKRILK